MTYPDRICITKEKYKALKQQNAALLAALEAFEWVFMDDSLIPVCLWCKNGKIAGHALDCQRQQALALVDDSGSERSE